MNSVLRKQITFGDEILLSGSSSDPRYSAVFEDDSETGYFYAIDLTNSDFQICDALQIYIVSNFRKNNTQGTIGIAWSDDGLKSMLLIDDFPHAIFNFEAKRGFCRTNFPESQNAWSLFDHSWDDEALKYFE